MTENTSQAWFMPPGLMVELRRQGCDWSRMVVLAAVGLRSSGHWPRGRALPDPEEDRFAWQNQGTLGELLGLSRQTISEAVRDLRRFTFGGRPVLSTTRKGSVYGCLAYQVPWQTAKAKTSRHLYRSVITSPAFIGLSASAAGLWLCLRDDFTRAASSGWLDCRIKGRDRDNALALADRYRTSPSVIGDGLRELEAAGFIKRARRRRDGRDVGIRLRLLEEAPTQVPSKKGPTRRRDSLLDQVGALFEDLQRGVAGDVPLTWRDLREVRTAGELLEIARRLRDYLRRPDGRRHALRAVYQRCLRLSKEPWRRRDAQDTLHEQEVLRDELAEAADQFSRGAAPAFAPSRTWFTPQEPSEHPRELLLRRWRASDDVGIAFGMWDRVKRSLRRAIERGEKIPDCDPDRRGVIGQYLTTGRLDGLDRLAWPHLELSPQDGDGPIFWVCSPSALQMNNWVRHRDRIRKVLDVRVGFALCGEAQRPSRGPP